MPSSRKLGFDTNAYLGVDKVLERFPWIAERKLNCVLSPDSDGLLCGLFMSHYLDWKIRGFYDGKVLVLESGFRAGQCVFLDMEIFRHQVPSVGQHMLLNNKRHLPDTWNNFDNCIAPNNLRDYDRTNRFGSKYPFGTIHILIAILGARLGYLLPSTGVIPLLFTDGTWENMFRYTENALDWIRYLGALDPASPLHYLFLNDEYTLHSFMSAMDSFLRQRDAISIRGERGDRVAITMRRGEGLPHNLVAAKDLFNFNPEAKRRAEQFLQLLAGLTEWQYKPADWSWGNWNLFQFTKQTLENPTIQSYIALMDALPISLAITGSKKIEYTIEGPSKFPL